MKSTRSGRRLTFKEYAHRYPPILCRLLARSSRGGHPQPLTIEEIAKRGGLTNLEVIMLSEHCSWDAVPFGAMNRFLAGCGMDFCSGPVMKKCQTYAAGILNGTSTFQYLRKSQLWTQTYEPMLKRYRQSLLQPSTGR